MTATINTTLSAEDAGLSAALEDQGCCNAYLRAFENRDIKIRSFFGMVVEPQEWGDFLHDNFPRV